MKCAKNDGDNSYKHTIHLLRDSRLVPAIQEKLVDFNIEDTLILSVVSIGEIEFIAYQQNYGKKKKDLLQSLLSKFLVIPIESFDLIDRYAEIDAYSQGKLPGKPLPGGMSSRNR